MFDVRIRDRQVTVGYAPEWSASRVRNLMETTLLPMAKQRQPWWEAVRPTAPATSGYVPSFHEAASSELATLTRYANASTRNAFRSPVVKHLLPFFAYEHEERTRERLVTDIDGAIDGALVTQFVAAKARERDVLRDLADTLAELDDATLRDPEALASQSSIRRRGVCSAGTARSRAVASTRCPLAASVPTRSTAA